MKDIEGEDGRISLFICDYRELFVGYMFRGIETNMKGGEACVVRPFISLFVTFNQLCFLLEMSLFNFRGRAFIRQSLGTVSAGGADAGTDEDKQWKKTSLRAQTFWSLGHIDTKTCHEYIRACVHTL